MNPFALFLFYLLTAAFIENAVLSTGFGSSIMLRIVRRPQDIFAFGGLLCGFSVFTVIIAYPVDTLIGTGSVAKLLRPVIMIVIAALLYIAVVLFTKNKMPAFYQRISRILPLAVFNNLVIGFALIVNHQFSLSLIGAIGLSLGGCLGFLLLSWLTAEGMERLDNPDMPQAFRGLPATLIYLGILALGLLGYSSGVSLI
jgi:electron transport complex protein RnfA